MQINLSVLHVNTSHAFGGLELYTLQLVKKIYETGTKTGIYCIPGSKLENEAKKLKIPIYHGIKQARLSLHDIKQVRKIVKDEGFQIIHSHTRHDVWLVSLALLCLKNKKHIFSLYMSAPAKKSLFHRFVYGKVAAITSSSEILNALICQNYPVSPEQVYLLRYGRELSNYKKNIEDIKKIKEQLGVKEGEFVIGAMCRIDPAKGVREIAESLLLLKPEIKNKVKIWIMGEPTLDHTSADGTPIYEPQAEELYNWLQNFTKSPEVDNRIQLIPFQQNIIPYLGAMDIFVLATYSETYSLAVIDAMGMGLPVIGTNSGGTPEQINNNTRGLLITPKSPNEIAEAISKYIDNPKLMWEHGENAKKWVFTEHSWQTKLALLKKLYCKILEK